MMYMYFQQNDIFTFKEMFEDSQPVFFSKLTLGDVWKN